jgi:hypothetical protein
MLNEVPHHEDVWGSGSIAPHTFLTSTLDVGEFAIAEKVNLRREN